MIETFLIDMSYRNLGGRYYKDICPTLTSRDYKEPRYIVNMRENKLGNINGYTGGNFSGNVYDKNYLSPALSTMSGGGNSLVL